MNEDVWLLVRRMRAVSLESRRAKSRCFLSSLCSGVKAARGGLDVIDRAILGGVRLASDPWLVMDAKSLSILELDGLCSRAPGQVKVDRGPIEKVGSNCIAAAVILLAVVVLLEVDDERLSSSESSKNQVGLEKGDDLGRCRFKAETQACVGR